MTRPKTFFFYKHQNKADALEKALLQFGWKVDRSLKNTTAAFFDVDILQRIELFNLLHERGVNLFIYPHAARPSLVYTWKDQRPHPFVSAQFVSGPGHEEIMHLIDYPHPVHDIGWSYCEKKEFQPCSDVGNVLFGALHPNANGWMGEESKEVNRRALARLKQTSKIMGFHITIRHIHSLEANGLPTSEDPEITYIEGSPDNCFEQIDAADLVVGHQTFAYLAIARGKPTLMMDEWITPSYGNSPELFAYIQGWEKIKHLVMYPLDINTADDVPALIGIACASDADIVDWRTRMIGADFSPQKFAATVEEYIQ